MGVSRLAQSIAESPTLRLNEEARTLRQQGQDVINLGIGEPKNPVPVTAVEGAVALLNRGDVKYTPTSGLPSLKQAIIRYTEEHYGRRPAPENVIVTAGAKQALHSLLFTLLNPQEEVVVLAPYWVSYPEIIRMVGGVPVVVRPDPITLRPRAAEVLDAITERTKAILLNSPNNPSGIIYPPDFVAELVNFCERRGVFLIADDIYHQLVFDGGRAAAAYEFTSREIDASHVLVVNGISKTYGMTGFRIGWAIGPRPLVQIMANVQAQTTSCASALSQAAAEGALCGSQACVEELRRTMEANRAIVLSGLAAIPSVTAPRPQGAFYCLPDFRSYHQDSMALSEFLLRKALVVTVPGKEFGMEGYLRLSFAGSERDLREGLSRIRWAVDPTSPKTITIGDRTVIRDWP